MNRFDYRLIRQMLLLASVVQNGSFSAAARALHMSQPPLISQVNELETRLRVKLLRRSSTGTTLTPEGRAILPAIEKLVSQAEALDYAARTIRKGTVGVLRIGAVYEVLIGILPGLLEESEEKYPEVSVFSEEIDSREAEYKLAQNELDIAFGRFERFRTPGLRLREIRRERPVVIFPKGDPLSGSESIRLADLKDREWIVTARDKCPEYADRVAGFFLGAGYSPRLKHEVDSIEREIAFVACRLGIGVIPEGCARNLPPSVGRIEVADPAAEFVLNAAWNEKSGNPSRDAFLSLMPWQGKVPRD